MYVNPRFTVQNYEENIGENVSLMSKQVFTSLFKTTNINKNVLHYSADENNK